MPKGVPAPEPGPRGHGVHSQVGCFEKVLSTLKPLVKQPPMRRGPGGLLEPPSKGPRRHVGTSGKRGHGERLVKVLQQPVKQLSEPTGLGYGKVDVLRLPTLPERRHDHAPSERVGGGGAVALADKMQAGVDAGSGPRAGENRPVSDIQHVRLNRDLWIPPSKKPGELPVGGGAPPVKHPSGGKCKGPGTDGQDGGTPLLGPPKHSEDRGIDRRVEGRPGRHRDKVSGVNGLKSTHLNGKPGGGGHKPRRNTTDRKFVPRKPVIRPIQPEHLADNAQFECGHQLPDDRHNVHRLMMAETSDIWSVLPLPRWCSCRKPGPMKLTNEKVAVAAPGRGPHQWAGAPSAALDEDGTVVLAYRTRGDGDRNVLTRSADGIHFTPVANFETEGMVERPSLIRGDFGWRMYTSCSTPGTKHWWVGMLESSTVEDLPKSQHHKIFPGSELTGIKDPVVRFDGTRWQAWVCCHPLAELGEEDRMTTAHTISEDGVNWQPLQEVLSGRPGRWDARGARLTTFLPDGRAAYDGRATAAENWFERTGFTTQALIPTEDEPLDFRYLEILRMPDGSHRAYYEARLPDETHELRTAVLGP